MEKLKSKIFLSMGFAGLVYLGLTIYADLTNVMHAFSLFSWLLFPLLLLLSFMNYVSRFYKWDYYMLLLKIKITKIDSFAIFMSGLVMSVTPGKMGELLKAYLVKQISGEPISKTAPIILAERITDFVSLVIIALIGAYVYDVGRVVVVGVGLFFLLLLIVISNRNISLRIISVLERAKYLKKFLIKIHEAYESSHQLLKFKPLLLMTLLSFVSWGFECLGYYIILTNFDVDVTMLWTSFSYTFATIIGAISFLPGGLGVTDGSLTYFIVNKNYSLEVAVASTFIIRVVTLWFAVLVGVISVMLYQKRFGKISFSFNNK